MLAKRIRQHEATPWRPDGTCGIGMRPSAKAGRRPYGGTERAWPACSHGKYLKLTGTRRKARASETWRLAVRAERTIPAPLSNSQFGKFCRKSFVVGHKSRKGLYLHPLCGTGVRDEAQMGTGRDKRKAAQEKKQRLQAAAFASAVKGAATVKETGQDKTEAKTAKNAKKQSRRAKAAGDEDDDDDIEAILASIIAKEKEKSAVFVDECPKPSARVNFTITKNEQREEEVVIFGGEYFNGENTYVYQDVYRYFR